MVCKSAASLLPIGNAKAPTLVNVAANDTSQLSLEGPLERSSLGSAIAFATPSAASAGPPARIRILREPPLTTTPTINVWLPAIVVRTERLLSRAVELEETTERVAEPLVTLPAALVTTTR